MKKLIVTVETKLVVHMDETEIIKWEVKDVR